MDHKKTNGMMLLIVGIIFVVYNLFVFLLFQADTAAFWISYAFMVVAFVFQIVAYLISFKNPDVRAAFFGIPLMQLALFYGIAELFASTIFILFQHQLSYKIPLLIQTALFALFLVIAILSLVGKRAAVDVNERLRDNVAAMQGMCVDVEMLASYTQAPELRARLARLAENFRYSDPMSTPAVVDLDKRLHQSIFELRSYCERGDVAQAMEMCNRTEYLLVERNKKLMLSK